MRVDGWVSADPGLAALGRAAANSAATTSTKRTDMAVVETERHGQVLVVRMNRPERLNALNTEMRTRAGRDLDRVPPQQGARGRDLHRHRPRLLRRRGHEGIAAEGRAPAASGPSIEDPFMTGALEKPVIAAVNGFAMGGGFMLVERTDLRRRRARGGVRGLRGQALAAGRLQSRPHRQRALSHRHGDGAGLPLHRRSASTRSASSTAWSMPTT